MKIRHILTITVAAFALASCASVQVTKTGTGYHQPVAASHVQILKTRPDRNFIELGVLDISGFTARQTAKMHNAIRSKAGPMGADAVIITDTSLMPDGWGVVRKYASAVAIKYK